MEFIQGLIADPSQALIIIAAVISVASLLAKVIEIVTGITASEKDDIYASKITKAVAKAKSVLDKLGLNPKQ